jgi:hypothetical protein
MKTLSLIMAFAFAILSFPTAANAQRINVTDKEGRAITAKLVSSDGTNVEIIRESDSKKFSLPLVNLNDATNRAIKRWMAFGGHLAESFEVTVDTGKSRRTSTDLGYDERRVNLEPIITVKNTDVKLASKELKLSIIFLGRPARDSSNIYVFRKQSFKLPKIAPLETTDLTVKPVSAPYDNRGDYKIGSRYSGYAWIIFEEIGGRIVASGSVPTSLAENNIKTIMELKTNATYTKDFKLAER